MPEANADKTPECNDGFRSQDEEDETGDEDVESECWVAEVRAMVEVGFRCELEGKRENRRKTNRSEAVRRPREEVCIVSDEFDSGAATL